MADASSQNQGCRPMRLRSLRVSSMPVIRPAVIEKPKLNSCVQGQKRGRLDHRSRHRLIFYSLLTIFES